MPCNVCNMFHISDSSHQDDSEFPIFIEGEKKTFKVLFKKIHGLFTGVLSMTIIFRDKHFHHAGFMGVHIKIQGLQGPWEPCDYRRLKLTYGRSHVSTLLCAGDYYYK